VAEADPTTTPWVTSSRWHITPSAWSPNATSHPVGRDGKRVCQFNWKLALAGYVTVLFGLAAFVAAIVATFRHV
jgi:hypothetical protein